MSLPPPASEESVKFVTNGCLNTEFDGVEVTLPNVTLRLTDQKAVLSAGSNHPDLVLNYRAIILHALSRGDTDSTSGSSNCNSSSGAHLYMQIDCADTRAWLEKVVETIGKQDIDMEDDEEINPDYDPSSDPLEFRFHPSEQETVQELFKVLSEMSALHPDPVEECGDSDDEEGSDASPYDVYDELLASRTIEGVQIGQESDNMSGSGPGFQAYQSLESLDESELTPERLQQLFGGEGWVTAASLRENGEFQAANFGEEANDDAMEDAD